MTGSQKIRILANRRKQFMKQLVPMLLLFMFAHSTVADVATQLDWDSVTWTPGSTNQSYAIGPGNVSINFNGPGDTPPGDTSALVNASPLITTDLTGGLSPVQRSLEINVDYAGGSSQVIPIIIDFSHPGGVSNVNFSIFDVDLGGWTDVVQVQATNDGINYFNPTTIISNAANSSDGINTITGTSGSVSSSNGTATFGFNTSGITQIRILYSNVNTAFQWVALHDINFTYPEPDLAINKSHVGVFNEGVIGTYTLGVSNNASAIDEPGAITVTDTLPAGLSFNSATGTGWTCGAVGQDVTCSHPGPLAAGSSLPDISLNVLAGAAAVPSVINTANVSGSLSDANTSDNTSSDSTVVVGAPVITPGNKPLYLYSAPSQNLSRAPPVAAQPNVIIRKNINPTETWILNPSTQASLTIDGDVGNIPVALLLRRGNTNPGFLNRTIQVELLTSLGSIGSVTNVVSINGTPSEQIFNVPITSDITIPAGSTISLRVTNVTPGPNNFNFRVFPVFGGNNSRVELTSDTVINVDSVQFYDAPFAGGSITTSFLPGETAYVRSVVSDPFGSFDISSATVTILDADGTAVVTNAGMTEVSDSGVSTKTYEYAQAIAAPLGAWTAIVTANEGSEGIVSDNNANTFNVGGTPDIVLLKSSMVIEDGLGNVAPTAKAIPGAIVQYTLIATNQGNGATDSNVVVEDPIPSATRLCVADPCAQGLPPIRFADAPFGTVGSGLASPVVSYSNSAIPPYVYGYTPIANGNGFDGAVTAVRVQPTGSFNAASSGTPAGFEITFRVQVQ